ncbi:unnamed protein product [Owenia fusiformis]|uniref:Sodium-dependent glucose transporter 1 n=1 Tax=Owenia fusiformis TaxID=6347 RepID=A0A8S4NKY3_OWEFU|nr:unnamed protein product [Owenia fusiformis]CAH1780991.1 unnamed protein product [Owenia fusiformis]
MSCEIKQKTFETKYINVADIDNTKEEDDRHNNNDDVNGCIVPLTDRASPLDKAKGEDDYVSKASSEKKVFRYKLIKTILLIVTWIVNGLVLTIKYPTFPDLCERTGSSVEELTRATAVRHIGYIIGCLVGGILFDRFRKIWDLQLSSGFLLLAVSVAFKPWCRGITALAFLYWLEGAAHGIFAIAGNGIMIAIWGGNTPAPLLAMHFGSRIGSLVAPVLAYPFLSSSRGEAIYTNASVFNNGTEIKFTSNIEVPYVISGGLGLLASLGYLGVYLAPRPRGLVLTNIPKGRNLKELLHPGSFTNGNARYGVTLMTCMFLYFSINGACSSHFQLLQASIATGALNATKQEASLMQFAARGSAILGNFIIIPVSKFVPMPFIVFVICHAIAIINFIAVAMALKSRMNFAVLGGVFDFFYASIWASGMAWPERYMEVTGSVIMICNIGSGVGGAIIEWGSGYVLQYHGAQAVMWLCAAFAISFCVLIYVTQCVMSYHGPKKRHLVPL